MKKAKHNSSRFITSAEKSSFSEYGTQKLRLGKDSQLQLNQCNICLQNLRNPTSCIKGHLFCKVCILENLLVQKKEIKRKKKEMKENLLLQEIRKNEQIIHQQQAKIENFLKQESSINIHGESESEAQKKEPHLTQSFWLPEQAPRLDVNSSETPIVDKIYCPNNYDCNHSINIKELIPVCFTSPKVRDDHDIIPGEYICPTCFKSLSCISKVYLLKNCGHVVCYKCKKEFIAKSGACPACSELCSDEYLIELQSSGSGFAMGGAKIVKKENPVARIV